MNNYEFHLRCEGSETSIKEVMEWIRPTVEPSPDTWFKQKLDIRKLDPAWDQADRTDWDHNNYPFVYVNLDDNGLSGDVSHASCRLEELICQNWQDLVVWCTAVWDHTECTLWRRQGTAEAMIWEQTDYGKYDKETGNEIGWHTITTFRDGVELSPPEIEFEKEYNPRSSELSQGKEN